MNGVGTFDTLCTSSQTLAETLSSCSCGSSCYSACSSSLCALEPPTSTCNSCLVTYCNTQLTACSNDSGGS
jgi:hypothetical protein